MCRWHAKVIRLPFNQEWVLQGCENHGGEDYMAALDTVIEWAAPLGAYTILDLHWLDISTVFATLRMDVQPRAAAPESRDDFPLARTRRPI